MVRFLGPSNVSTSSVQPPEGVFEMDQTSQSEEDGRKLALLLSRHASSTWSRT